MTEYHLQFNTPNENWPNGAVSVYQISGSQIADREVRAEIVKPERGPAYYTGDVIARHSWCGYIGMFETLEEACAAIKADEAEQKIHAAKMAKRYPTAA